MDSRAIADKYISRGGGSPEWSSDEFALDLMQLSNFILWHRKNDMHGCVYPHEAFAAMCRLLNVEQHRIRQIIKPDEPATPPNPTG